MLAHWEKKAFTVVMETFESVASYWVSHGNFLKWDCLFVLPAWLKAWWESFGGESKPHLCSVWCGNDLLGIAALMLEGKKASFMGSLDVCDYFDFVVTPGKESEFLLLLVEHLKQQGISHLDLGPVRSDSAVITELIPIAKGLGYEFYCGQEDVSFELELPATWEEFLSALTGKERHEIRRKLRRLDNAASTQLRVVEDIREVRSEIDTFLRLFTSSRSEKAAFLTAKRAVFFHSLAEAMASLKILKLFFLDLDGKPAAAALCFDYHSTVYLYNSGYDPQLRPLSVGLLDKVLSIRESIQRGRKKYDFLKGAEEYKYRLGGKPIPLYRCQVELR